MKKTYALYNIDKHCLEHLERVDFHSKRKYTIFKLDNLHGYVWTTNDLKIAETVKSGRLHDLSRTSKEIPYNPYNSSKLEIVELDLSDDIKHPIPSLLASADVVFDIGEEEIGCLFGVNQYVVDIA